MATNINFDPNLDYRIAYCTLSKCNVIQCKDPKGGDNCWVCLHGDTLDQEREEMQEFINNFPNGYLEIFPNVPLSEYKLISGHLIHGKLGINIMLWDDSSINEVDKIKVYGSKAYRKH